MAAVPQVPPPPHPLQPGALAPYTEFVQYNPYNDDTDDDDEGHDDDDVHEDEQDGMQVDDSAQNDVPAPSGGSSNVLGNSQMPTAAGDITVGQIARTQEWICCDKCNKWRKVPIEVDFEALQALGEWYCRYNTWDKRFSKCSAKEESAKPVD
jgi:hypothetical protein